RTNPLALSSTTGGPLKKRASPRARFEQWNRLKRRGRTLSRQSVNSLRASSGAGICSAPRQRGLSWGLPTARGGEDEKRPTAVGEAGSGVVSLPRTAIGP